ncbi:hypothetical protein MOKP4_17510 [Mycobacterium avium subsp. hominissuis]|nr:hypothetical protein O984_07500 [Mycobacterium avium 05-4293]ETB08461.1 hypothetical protein P863_14180 [Mycobacterium avium subsp. silvaticum ATCC 49884]ETB15765.1 hypothetical protein O972_15030 [Mycobacterium avium subsp. avium 10-9275]ETB20038.1 hypothetical protein O973_14320 [Mycobacterium avium subsp. avium 11-4751]ETB23900.1 hypothetical protein O983_14465 [Mycobacterium avium 09-5983]QGW31419.1 hypothetical protein MAA44156_01171 [Mycobacterium avium subsp. avium]
MDRLEVTSAELRMLSGKWHTNAARLRVATPPPSGMSYQPSAVAVDAAHAAVEVAANSLIGRMTETATKVAAADISYTANEADSAEKMSAIGRQPARQ